MRHPASTRSGYGSRHPAARRVGVTRVNVGYRYFGLLFGRLRIRVALLEASFAGPNDHAAVWLGASSHDAREWIQAGIEVSTGDEHPFLYVERGSMGRQVAFERRPWEFGKPATVRLRRGQGKRWRASVEGLQSRRRGKIIARPSLIATLETLGDAKTVARIGRKQVSS